MTASQVYDRVAGFVDANQDGCDFYELLLLLLRAPIRAETPIAPPSLQDLEIASDGARRLNAMVAKDDRADVVLLTALDGVTIARKR